MPLEPPGASERWLTRGELSAWLEVAASTRINASVLDRLIPAREGSFLRPTAEDPLRKMAWWCHGYLEAAIDHLLLWADHTVPMAVHHDAVTIHRLRPTFTLARAAIESAAQVVWALGPDDAAECGRRFIHLVLWDLDEQTKAAVGTNAHADLSARRSEMLAAFGLTNRAFTPPRYLEMIRYVAGLLHSGEQGMDITGARAERIWRSTAGAAHGKQWLEFEFHDHVEAGEGLVYSTPRLEEISVVLRLADQFVTAGVTLFAIRTGHQANFQRMRDEAASCIDRDAPA